MSTDLDLARRALAGGDLAGVLNHVSRMYEALRWLEELPPFPAGVREADQLLEAVGCSLWESRSDVGVADGPLQGACVLTTTLSPTGGHTAIIKDLSAALPEPPSALWITRPHPDGSTGLKDWALERTGLADVARVFGGQDAWECARRMVEALAGLRPARVFLVHHPADCVAVVVAAAARTMGSSVCLLHHTDAKPSAGLFLSGVEIVDFTPRACAFTRSMLGLRSAWLPLTCPDPGEPEVDFMASAGLTTALSGGEWKVAGMACPTYPELVAGVLEAGGGTHVHIGPLTPRMKRRVRGLLRKRGFAAERVIWVPQAPTLVQGLREHGVDLLINTSPPGARSVVEAMAAGVPIVWFSPTEDLDQVRAQMRYPEALLWRNIEDLRTLVSQIDRPWLERQGAAARSWYEKIHHPRLWAEGLADLDAACARELPPGFTAEMVTRQILEHALEQRETQRGSLRSSVAGLASTVKSNLGAVKRRIGRSSHR
jgi:hypothetical protein